MICFPCLRAITSWYAWALADVASKSISISLKTSILTSPSIPLSVISIPNVFARARPSEFGSIPTRTAMSKTVDVRIILIIRSVPIFPEPIMATFVFIEAYPLFAKNCSNGTKVRNSYLYYITRLDWGHWT